MAHEFLVNGDNGAAAVLGATTITLDSSDRLLGRYVTPWLAAPNVTIGQAMLLAKQELAASGGASLYDVLVGWTVLGDPALVIDPQ
jgi:hypothetical protein